MFKRMFRVSLTPVAAALAIAVALPAGAEDLVAVYRDALQNDPQYLAAKGRSDAAAEGVTIARSVLLPQIGLTGSLSETDSNSSGNQVFGSTIFPSNTEGTSTNEAITLRLDQEIYHHDSWVGLSQAKKRAKQAELSYAGELQGLIIRASQAYFDLLAAQDGVELAAAELESIGKQLEQTKQRFNVGLIAITDVHEAQARYDQTQANLIVAQNTLDNANETLRQITGNYYKTLSRVRKDHPLVTPEPANPEDWVKVAEEQNISLLAQRLGVEVAREEIKRQRAGHYPTVDLNATYRDATNDGDSTDLTPPISTSQFDNTNETTTVGVQVSVPIFAGMRTMASTDQATANFVVASQDMEKLHREVIRDTRSSFLGLTAAISTIRALTQAEVSAQSALEATQAGFDVGTRTIVDVLTANSNLYNAKRNLWRARYAYAMNILKLRQAAGTLTEADIQAINNWLEVATPISPTPVAG